MKDTYNLRLKFREIHGEHHASGVEDQVATLGQQIHMAPNGLPHAALDAITLVRFAQNLASGEPYARTWRLLGAGVSGLLRGQKPAHGRRLALATGRIGTLIVGVLAQARAG